MKKYYTNKGFTLIELLLVISIISLLSSIVLVSTNIARAKANDVAKKVDAAQVRTALALYNDSTGNMPGNYLAADWYDPTGNGDQMAFEDMTNPDNPTTQSGIAYNRSMQILVDAKVLGSIPHSQGGQPYGYYNFGSGNYQGAVFATSLEFASAPVDSCNIGGLSGSTYYPYQATSIPDVICTWYPGECMPGDTIIAQGPFEGSKNLAAGGGGNPQIHCRKPDNSTYYADGGYSECHANNICTGNVSNEYCICNPY